MMRYKDDGDEAIRKLDGMEWGYKRRKLKVRGVLLAGPRPWVMSS
jgi:hypothetical protein